MLLLGWRKPKKSRKNHHHHEYVVSSVNAWLNENILHVACREVTFFSCCYYYGDPNH